MKQAEKIIILEKEHNDIILSWTYQKMTQAEKERVRNLVDWVAGCGPLKAMTNEQAIHHLFNVMYHSFLVGIGYTGANWREPKESGKR